MFSKKELDVIRMKMRGLMNKDIAKNLGVSEPDISQTLKRLREKVRTVQDSIELLTSLGMIKEGPKYVLTEKGRALTLIPEKKVCIEPVSIEKTFLCIFSPSFTMVKKEDLIWRVYRGIGISELMFEYPTHEFSEKTFIPRHGPLEMMKQK